ncbi:MAG: HAMP domain-containing sensor histidine kinase [Gammaproteobacteria bacterium]
MGTAPSDPLPLAGLESAFAAFATASARLETAYSRLEAEAGALRDALATTTAERDAARQTVRDRQLDVVLSRHQRLAALGEMAATLAHQIRTPLSAALLYTSNAANPALAPIRRDELLQNAIGCLHNLEQLISDMLGFARGATASNAPVALTDLCETVRTGTQALLRPGQQLTIASPAVNAMVCGNRQALGSALLNIVTNGLQSAGPAAKVEITTRIIDGMVEIRVADNGPGIPSALHQRIFEPFYTSRTDGTGLGLAVVKSVVEAHGGEVHVESDVGACFVLRLPLVTRIGHLREHQVA